MNSSATLMGYRLKRLGAWVSGQLSFPLLSELIRNRTEALILGVVGALQIGLTALHVAAWPCPIEAVLGFPCPGCGLSRACVMLLRGDWSGALAMHAFAPLILGGVGLLWVGALLPGPRYARFVEWVATFERHTWVSAWSLIGLLIYWIFRLGGIIPFPAGI